MKAATDEWAAEAWHRCMVGHGQRQFQIPMSIRADRTWLLDPWDAPYVEGMAAYLFDGAGDEPPVLGTRAYVAPAQLAAEEREHRKAALSASVLYGRVMSFDDLSVVRTAATHRTRVSRASTQCVVEPASVFAPLPRILRDYPHPLGTPAALPRVAYYFAGEVARADEAAQRRFELAVELEHVVCLTVGLDFERRVSLRGWLVPDATMAYLGDYRGLPSIPMLGPDGYRVTIDRVLRDCEAASRAPAACRTSRECWATGGLQLFVTFRPDGSYVMPRRRGGGPRNRGAGSSGRGAGGYQTMNAPPGPGALMVAPLPPTGVPMQPGTGTPPKVAAGNKARLPPSVPSERAPPPLRSQPVPPSAAEQRLGQLVLPDLVVRQLFGRVVTARDDVRPTGWPLQALGLLVNQRIDALMTESQRRGDDVRRRLAAAEADLARERATVDRWVAWNEEQERVRRTEARNPPRSDVGGRYRSRVPERDDYADDDGYGYDIEYGQKRPRCDDY